MYLKDAVHRIDSINWSKDGTDFSPLHGKLGVEFLRRLACFYEEMSIKPLIPLYSNIAKFLGSTNEIDILKYCSDETIKKLSDTLYQRKIFEYYLELAKYADEHQDITKFLTVYEPLINIVEEGGNFILRQNELNILNVSHIPLNNWYERFLNREPLILVT